MQPPQVRLSRLRAEVSLELIQKGVRVNAIAPGWIRVENQEKALGSDFDWQEAEKTLPAGFIGTPSDIGQLALFLASDDSRHYPRTDPGH